MSITIIVIPRQGLTAEDAALIAQKDADIIIFRGKIGQVTSDTTNILSRKNVYSTAGGGPQMLGVRRYGEYTLVDASKMAVSDVSSHDTAQTIIFAWQQIKTSHATVVYNDFAIYNITSGLPPNITWLHRQPEVIMTIHGEPIYRGVVVSATIQKHLVGDALEDYYAGINDDIGVIVDPHLSKDRYSAEVLAANKRLAQLVGCLSTPQIAMAAARRYSAARKSLLDLDEMIGKFQLRRGRSVSEIVADIGESTEPPMAEMPKTPRPAGNLSDLRAELAEIDAKLATPIPVLVPLAILDKNIAEIEAQLPSAAGLPAELAAQVAKYDKPQLRAKLVELRETRSAAEQVRRDLAARTHLEARRGLIQASIADWSYASQWAAYDKRRQWEQANARLAALHSELTYAKSIIDKEAELADLLTRRANFQKEVLQAACMYGAATGQACVIDVDNMCQQLADAVAFQEAVNMQAKKQQADRQAALKRITDRAEQIMPGARGETLRASYCLALAEQYGARKLVYLKQPIADTVMRRLIETFPIVLMPKLSDYATHCVEVSIPTKTMCTCGREVRTALLQKHLASARHRSGVPH